MSTFRKDVKLGTMVPMIRGDDIANESVGWEHLTPALQSLVVKYREEDIRLADIDLSVSKVREVMSGEGATRLRVISNVRGTVRVMGMLEMYGSSDGNGIVQVLHTEFQLDEKNTLKPTSQGIPTIYFRQYKMNRRTWSAWSRDTECISNDKIDKIVDNVYKPI